MGFQNDYILRLIEDLSAVFASIASGEASPTKRIADVDQALKDYLNIDPMFLFSGLKEQLHTIDPKAASIIAELLFLRVKALMELDRYSESSLLSAIDFANRAREGDEICQKDAIQILSKLLIHVTDTQTLEALLKTFEKEQKFGAAEDTIFQLIHKNPEFSKIGMDFYDRILLFDDLTLQKGGLPRSEVLDAISELRNLA